MSETSEEDALDALLAPGRIPVANEGSRQALLSRTTGVLRRRRWWRRAGLTAALAACYLAGLATMRLAMPSTTSPDRQAEMPVKPLPDAAPAVAQLVRPQQSVPADVLERWAPGVSDEQPAQLYRRIGDRYLKDGGDVQAALRCYTQALETSSESDLTPAAEDDFLLMALKDARQKEKRHANDGG